MWYWVCGRGVFRSSSLPIVRLEARVSKQFDRLGSLRSGSSSVSDDFSPHFFGEPRSELVQLIKRGDDVMVTREDTEAFWQHVNSNRYYTNKTRFFFL